MLKGCENTSQNVPIRHQNIRERNCQWKLKNSSKHWRQRWTKDKKEIKKWSKRWKNWLGRLSGIHPPLHKGSTITTQNFLIAIKQYVPNCKRKSSLKGLNSSKTTRIMVSWVISKTNWNVYWIQQVIDLRLPLKN